MEFSKISLLCKAVQEGKIKETDCIRFYAQNNTLIAEKRSVRILHDIGCFFAKGILKVITSKKLTDYVIRHSDSATVFWNNTKIEAFKNLKGKVTGKTLKLILNNENNKKLLTDYNNVMALSPEITKLLPKAAHATTTSYKTSQPLFSVKSCSIKLLHMLRDTKKTANDIEKFLIQFNTEQKELIFKYIINNIKDTDVFITASSRSLAEDNNSLQETQDIINLLMDHGASIKSNFITATSSSKINKKILSCLINCFNSNDLINKFKYDESLASIIYTNKDNDNIVKQLINKGIDINICNNEDMLSPLHAAIKAQRIDIAKILIEKGAFVNSQDIYGVTPLMSACKNGNKEMIELLLQHSASVSMQDHEGITALEYVESENKEEIQKLFSPIEKEEKHSQDLLNILKDKQKSLTDIKEFLDKFPDITNKLLFKQINDMPYSHIEAVLARTDQNSDSETIEEVKNIIKLLIDKNAPLNGIDKEYKGLISRIISNKCNDEVILYLIDSVESNILNKQINEKDTSLITAFYKYKDVITSKLIRKTDINQYNKNGRTALHYVALEPGDNIEKMQKLLDNKADINLQDTKGNTPLIIASLHENEELVKLLLKNNADINCQNSQGKTALMYACENEKKESVKLLLKNNADINCQNSQGKTALMYACENQNTELVKLLLEHGADPSIRGNEYTAIDYARNNQLTEIKQLLIDKINDFKNNNESLVSIIYEGKDNDNIIKNLINKGIDINICDRKNMLSPLHAAIKAQRIDIAKILIEKGAFINSQDIDGVTPLMSACENGNKEMIELLLDHDASVSMQDYNERTALEYVEANNKEEIQKLFSPVEKKRKI